AVDWLHVLAGSAWAGGLICLGLVIAAPARAWPVDVVGAAIGRFSRLAGWCLLAVVLSGVYNARVQLPGPSALWTTPYGRVLAVKLLVVLVLAGSGAVNRFAIVSRLCPGRARSVGTRAFRIARVVLWGRPRGASRAHAAARLWTYLLAEALLGLLVFLCTATLVDSAPPRHAGHEHAMAEAASGPFRVTMEDLHAQGGVPRGWRFTPPAGAAARGGGVFERLACFACHRVAGERFPASSGIGPDLTDVGGHHPAAYLMESILDPNAVIVEGPGHTGPDGRSIMPDY